MTLYRQKTRLYEATFDPNIGGLGTWTLVPCMADGKPLPAVAHQTLSLGPDQFNLEFEAVPKHVGSTPPDPVKQIVAWLRKKYRLSVVADEIEAGEWKDPSGGDVK